MKETWEVPFEGAWLGSISLTYGATLGVDGIVHAYSIYPVTIVQARYQGTYEGAPWLCMPTSADHLRGEFWDGWNDSDIECMQFWNTASRLDYVIGYGRTPDGAYDDLIRRVKLKAGVGAGV